MRKINILSLQKSSGSKNVINKPLKPSEKRPLKPTFPKIERVHKKKSFKTILTIIVLFLLVSGIAFGGYFAVQRWMKYTRNGSTYTIDGEAEACTSILNPDCWTEAFRPQLKQENGKTSALIIGIDSRASGSGSKLMNTDTIILATIDHATGKTRMISFPRDLYASYGCPESGKMPYKTKINAIYAYGKFNCPSKDGMATLIQTISAISGEKIQYSAIVRLEGVIKAIDSIGGITVDIPKDHTDVYPYIELPPELQQTCERAPKLRAYCVFRFKAGKTPMDGQMALIYARMRYWSDDFDRGRRQQEVIKGVKDKIMGDDTPLLTKAENLLSVYSSLKDYIDTVIEPEMVLAGLDLANRVDKDPASIVMDPGFGGGGLIASDGKGNYAFKDYSYKQVKDKLAIINTYHEYYKDRPTLLVSNRTGLDLPVELPVMQMRGVKNWFYTGSTSISVETKPVEAGKTGVEIVDYSNGSKISTINRIKKEFEALNTEVVITTATAENALVPVKGENFTVIIYTLASPVTPTE